MSVIVSVSMHEIVYSFCIDVQRVSSFCIDVQSKLSVNVPVLSGVHVLFIL